MFRRKFLMAAAVAAIASLVGPAISQAGFQVSATVGGNSATITDNNIAPPAPVGTTSGVLDINPATGTISTPTIPQDPTTVVPGAFTVGGVQIGMSASSFQNSAEASLTTSTDVVVRNTTGAVITLTLTISNQFTSPAGAALILSQSMTIDRFFQSNGSAYGSDVVTSDSVSGVASATPDPTSTGSLGSNTGVYSASNSVFFNRTNATFTVSQTFTVVLQAGEATKFQGTASVTPTPAPAGVILAATAVPFLGLLRRRMRPLEAATV